MRNAQLPAADERWTDDEARLVLEAWRQSGDSGAVFARARGLKAPRLYRWSNRLRGRAVPKQRAVAAMSLVPAVVTTKDAELVIRVPNGVAIEIAHGSPTWIATVISELMRTSP
jgi:hypothetical protein